MPKAPRSPIRPVVGGVISRLVPGIGAAVIVVDGIDALFPNGLAEGVRYPTPHGYRLVHDCGRRPFAPPYLSTPRGARISGHTAVPGTNRCVSGQAPSGSDFPYNLSNLWEPRQIVVNRSPALRLAAIGRLTQTIYRMRNDVWWARIGGAGGTVAVRYRPHGLAPVPGPINPNIVRGLPGEAPSPVQVNRPAQEPAQEPAPEWQYEPEGQGRPQPRHRRQPPRGGTRENKTISRSARVGIALYRALDWISEKAEIVDALYDALPDDVKERWGRDRDGRFADQAGQYGIDGADWKLQALYHNWHRLNATDAIVNIIANHIEDKIIGQVHAIMPRNTVNAFDFVDVDGQPMTFELWVAAQVKAALKALGLDD